MRRLLGLALAGLLQGACGQIPTLSDTEDLHLVFQGKVPDWVSAEQRIWAEAEFIRQKECVGWTGRLREPLPVDVYPQAFYCGNAWANGCQVAGMLQVNVQTFEGALSHELIHFFEMKNGWLSDFNHERPVWRKCDHLNFR